MNNVLFGVIGLLLLGITGIGYAEVKTQLHTAEVASAAQEDDSDSSVAGDMVGAASVSSNAKVSGKVSAQNEEVNTTPDTVPQVLSDVAARVEMALFDNWDEDEDEEEEDEDGDEDDDDHHSSKTTSSTVTSSNTNTNTTAQTGTNKGASSGTSAGVATFTMAQVAQHNSAASCYSAIDGSVYDLTSFVTKHPGGQSAIKSLCGVDGTAAFSSQHGGQGKPESVLAQYKIGVLAR